MHHIGKYLTSLQTPPPHPLVGDNGYLISALEQRNSEGQALYPFLGTLTLQVGNLRLLGPFQLTFLKHEKEKDHKLR